MQGIIVYKDNNSNNGPTSLPGKWEEAEASKLPPIGNRNESKDAPPPSLRKIDPSHSAPPLS